MFAIESKPHPGTYLSLSDGLHEVGQSAEHRSLYLLEGSRVISIDDDYVLREFSGPNYTAPRFQIRLRDVNSEIHASALLEPSSVNRGPSRRQLDFDWNWQSDEKFLVPSPQDRLVFLMQTVATTVQSGEAKEVYSALFLVDRSTRDTRLFLLPRHARTILSGDCRKLYALEISPNLRSDAREFLEDSEPRALFDALKLLPENSLEARLWSIDLAGHIVDVAPISEKFSTAHDLNWDYAFTPPVGMERDWKSDGSCHLSNAKQSRTLDRGTYDRQSLPHYRAEIELWRHSELEPSAGQKASVFALPSRIDRDAILKLARRVADKTFVYQPSDSSTTRIQGQVGRRILDMFGETTGDMEEYAHERGYLRVPTFLASRRLTQTLFQVVGVARGNFEMANWTFCQIDEAGEQSFCVVTFSNGWGDDATISTTHHGLFSSGQTEGADVVEILDLDSLRMFEVALPESRKGIYADFKPDGSLLALTSSENDVFIVDLAARKLASQLSFSMSDRHWPGFNNVAWYRDTLLIDPSPTGISRVSQRGEVLWSTHGLSSVEKFEVSEEDGTVFVRGGGGGRLISGETGAWLSGEVSVDDLIRIQSSRNCASSDGESPELEIDEIRFPGNGVVAVRVSDCWFVRQKPLKAGDVRDRLEYVDEITGDHALRTQTGD